MEKKEQRARHGETGFKTSDLIQKHDVEWRAYKSSPSLTSSLCLRFCRSKLVRIENREMCTYVAIIYVYLVSFVRVFACLTMIACVGMFSHISCTVYIPCSYGVLLVQAILYVSISMCLGNPANTCTLYH